MDSDTAPTPCIIKTSAIPPTPLVSVPGVLSWERTAPHKFSRIERSPYDREDASSSSPAGGTGFL